MPPQADANAVAAPISKRRSIAIIALTQVGAMALWFSASAVVPSLVAEYAPTAGFQLW